MNKVIIYKKEANLGNTMQTMGLCHLVDQSSGVWFDEIKQKYFNYDDLLICNGWYGHYPSAEKVNTIFCGIHVSNINPVNGTIIEWLRSSKKPIGARDPETAKYLNGIGIKSEFVGCGTLMFEPYTGNREGKISVDFNGPAIGKKYTHTINPNISWKDRWKTATDMINIYKKAELVYTSRLHVALPCLALGTPVFINKNSDTARFSILDELGIKYNKVQSNIDVSWLKARYKNFLEQQLNKKLSINNPTMPTEPTINNE